MSDFYDLTHEGQRLIAPRVTAILGVIDKSAALIGWATRVTSEEWRAALEEALTTPGGDMTAQAILARVDRALKGKRQWSRDKDAAADIGRAAHAMIQWHTRKMLGLDTGPEPGGTEASTRAVVAWLDWVRAVDFVPLWTERTIYCPSCAIAGTCDAVAKVEGRVTLVDYKTGKAVYPEAHLQVRAYRHCLAREGIATEDGLILRLPKLASDPTFEAVPAMAMPYDFFLHVARTWRVNRWLRGQETGNTPMRRCCVEDSQ